MMESVRQTLHVFVKDVVRLRWWIAALTGWVLALALAVPLVTHGTLAGEPVALFLNGAILLPGTVLFAIFAGLLIQEDSPARTDAFWVTQPLRPGSVLSAKLLGLTLFGLVLPMMGELVALAFHGMQALDALRMMPRGLALQAASLLGAAVAAAVTRDLRSFLLVLAVGWFSFFFFMTLVLSLTSFLGVAPGVSGFDLRAVTVVRAALWLLAAVGVLSFQYRHRRPRLGLALAVLALIAVTVSGAALAPRLASNSRAPFPAWAGAGSPRLDPAPEPFRVALTELQFDPSGADGRTGWVLHGTLTVVGEGADEEWMMWPDAVHLRWPGGSLTKPRISGVVSFGAAVPMISGYAQQGPRNPWYRARNEVWLGHLTPSEHKELAGRTVTIEIDGEVSRRVWNPLGSLPLRPGARTELGGLWFEVASVSRSSDRLSVSGRGERVTPGGSSSGSGALAFALARHDLQEYTVDWSGGGGAGGRGHGFVLPGSSALPIGPRLDLALDSEQRSIPDPGWVSGAELVVLAPVTGERHRRRLVIENVTLPR